MAPEEAWHGTYVHYTKELPKNVCRNVKIGHSMHCMQ